MAASAQDAHPWPIYNARFRVVFPILDADGDLVTAAATLDSELSQDQGTFADATNEATEIATGSGMYYLDLLATELDTKSTAIIVKTASAGAKTTPLVLYPKRLPILRTGTAQAGAATTITLDTGASALDAFYTGCYINITNNSPVNALGQARRITAYVGSTKVATIEGTWGTNPDVTSTFEILLPGDTVNAVAWAGSAVPSPSVAGTPKVDPSTWDGSDITTGVPLAPTVAGRTLDVSGTGEAGVDWANIGSPTTVNNLSATNIDVDQVVASVSGAVGSVTGAVGSVTGAVGSVGTGGITAASFGAGAIDAASIAANAIGASEIATDAIGAAQLAASAVDEIWDEAMTELAQAAPSATPAMRALLAALYMAIRNQVTVTSTSKTFSNDAGTVVFKKTLSDDGTTYTEAETIAGP